MLLFRSIKHAARTLCMLALLVWGLYTIVNFVDKHRASVPPRQKEHEVELVVASLKESDVRWFETVFFFLSFYPNWNVNGVG